MSINRTLGWKAALRDAAKRGDVSEFEWLNQNNPDNYFRDRWRGSGAGTSINAPQIPSGSLGGDVPRSLTRPVVSEESRLSRVANELLEREAIQANPLYGVF